LESGNLYVAATPIGNLEDITLRAARVLGEVDFIAAENTRHAGRLLSRYKIKTPVIPYSRDKNRKQAVKITERIKKGESGVLITNAGTPCVSDPGPELIRLAAREGIPVKPLPGPSALAAAVSVSGMPSSDFIFLGYLSVKSGRRRKELRRFAPLDSTIILYESPYRLLGLLEDIRDELGDKYVVICRELTKKFEETVRGNVSRMIELFTERPPRGEFTVIISGRDEE
jgi:16S rRNA (cytidine1402-2'-O)-methyltransferase